MKLVSWNVNGIRACVQKGFLDFFQEIDADIHRQFTHIGPMSKIRRGE